MQDNNKDYLSPEEEEMLMNEPPLPDEFLDEMDGLMDLFQDEEPTTEITTSPVILFPETDASEPESIPGFVSPEVSDLEIFADESAMAAHSMTHPAADTDFEDASFSDDAFRNTTEESEEFNSALRGGSKPAASSGTAKNRPANKGRPKRKKGAGFLGIPHLIATVIWLVIIVAIGTSLGRMIWVCAADVLAFGRESKKVSITIDSNDTIADIAQTLHEAGLIRYPSLFELYAKIAVDDGDILPGTFEMDTLYDYHALVVQMGPRSSNRAVVEDLLIPEGYNCRQIFELLEAKNVCTVAELEEYAASGEFSDFWFLEGVERGDRYCLEGFLFPDTYDFYMNSTPREALGKMLLGFEAKVDQEEVTTQLAAVNERLAKMMRNNGCSEAFIAENMLDLRGLLTVASLIEEESASFTESPTIASVIFNRYTQDQVYERYLGIDAALIYATGDPNNIDTSIDHPYNTYKNPGLTPGPITNPGLSSINAALNFADTRYYYYVLNPETGLSDFSRTKEEHDAKVQKYYGGSN